MFLTFDEIKTGQTAAPPKYDSQGMVVPANTIPAIPAADINSFQTANPGLQFNNEDVSHLTASYTTPAATPATPSTANYSAAAGYNGSSIVDFLSAAGQPSTFDSRSSLAKQYGIQNYQGTSAQNTQLLGLLKAHATGNMNNLGVPNNITDIMGGPEMPKVGAPVDASTLSLSGSSDLDKILKASIANGTIDSQTAGLLALSNSSTSADQQYNDILKQLTDAETSLGSEGADLKTALNDQGVTEATNQLKQLNLGLAQKQGAITAFDAETQTGIANLQKNGQGQGAVQGIINTDVAAYQKGRDLTKLAMSADYSATAALVQAYQGNIELGTKLAHDSVDMKYAPVLNQIDVLKTQLSAAGDNRTSQNSKVASVINSLLDLRKNEIDSEKDKQKDIQSLAIEAATNGAPVSVVSSMQSASDAVAAATIGSKWIKGNLESLKTGTGNSTPVDKGVQFTQDDVQRLIGAGFSSVDVKNLQSDINKYGSETALAGLPDLQKKEVQNLLKGVTPTQEQNQEADTKQFLNADYFKNLYSQKDLEKAATDAGYTTDKQSGGLFGSGVFSKSYKTADVDGYLQHLQSLVDQYRKSGYSDQDILKMMS